VSLPLDYCRLCGNEEPTAELLPEPHTYLDVCEDCVKAPFTQAERTSLVILVRIEKQLEVMTAALLDIVDKERV
jgi:hypothetical protein